MKAISLRQPWAWLVVNGFKDIENRSWATRLRGTVLIHAAKNMTRSEYMIAAEIASDLGVAVPLAGSLEKGGVVGKVDITDCVTNHSSLWFFGAYGFTLANAAPCSFIPCKGKLSFFDIDQPLPAISSNFERLNCK